MHKTVHNLGPADLDAETRQFMDECLSRAVEAIKNQPRDEGAIQAAEREVARIRLASSAALERLEKNQAIAAIRLSTMRYLG